MMKRMANEIMMAKRMCCCMCSFQCLFVHKLTVKLE